MLWKIKEWEQDGLELAAFTEVDYHTTFEDWDEPTNDEDTQEFRELYFSRKRQYEAGVWSWVGVVVTASKFGVELGSASLWGIESDSSEYHQQVADELADEAIDDARQTIQKLVEEVA